MTGDTEEQGRKYTVRGSDYGVADQVVQYRQSGQEDWLKWRYAIRCLELRSEVKKAEVGEE